MKKTSDWLLTCVVAYSVLLLFFVTVKDIFNENAETISAFGSILGAFGTFFTALVAVYVFNGWRITEDHKTKNNHINNAINSYFKLQDNIKLVTEKGIEINRLCSSRNFGDKDRIEILIIVGTIQKDISFHIRELKTHIQLFSTIRNEQTLIQEFEQILNNLSSHLNEKYNTFVNVNKDRDPQEIEDCFHAYSNYIFNNLLNDIYHKIIIKIAKKSKAVD